MPISGTDLQVSRLCFGGNVFGWTVDAADAFRLLDRFVDHGGNFIDTADVYSAWHGDNVGGESETIIGEWVKSRRRTVVVATKVGLPLGDDAGGLTRPAILRRVEGSLRRLQAETIDLLYAHRDDPHTPLSETLETFDELVRTGKVRHVAASNYDAARLEEALDTAATAGLAPFVALESHYSLLTRQPYEGAAAAVCAARGLAFFPYFGLEKGFLTGKYRPGVQAPSGLRAHKHRPEQYLDERGIRILQALDTVAARHAVPLGAVSLAWLLTRPTVTSVIASARTTQQLDELVPAMNVKLSAEDVDLLTSASD